MRSKPFSTAVFLAALPLFALAGCGKKEVAKTPPKPAGPPRVAAEVLQKEKPNEAGAVMVIMYHRFIADEKESDLNRRPETFKKDLETLHAKNYYPVNAIDLVTNNMDVPAGKTPVVITFDDALPTQFRVIEKDGEAKIDPNCAVGIMENFSKKHPGEWPMRATFFVLPKEGRNAEPFGQAESIADKFEYLVKKGYEVANHTSTHSSLRGMDVKKIQWELATAHKDIKAINEGAAMETLALPYGKMPRKEDAKKALLSGSDGGISYEHKAVFLAAWRPVMSPLTKADKKFIEGGSIAVFETIGLERVTPDARNAKSPGTLEYWLAYFDKNPNLRYVSDGDAKVAAIPESLKNAVDESRAKAQGKIVQFYGGGSSGGKKSGGLSVD
jgi:peptidoglycan/xylan/chitin deacetylase (PgdA/CDA1 family)/predicted small lipoprotein YifL